MVSWHTPNPLVTFPLKPPAAHSASGFTFFCFFAPSNVIFHWFLLKCPKPFVPLHPIYHLNEHHYGKTCQRNRYLYRVIPCSRERPKTSLNRAKEWPKHLAIPIFLLLSLMRQTLLYIHSPWTHALWQVQPPRIETHGWHQTTKRVLWHTETRRI